MFTSVEVLIDSFQPTDIIVRVWHDVHIEFAWLT